MVTWLIFFRASRPDGISFQTTHDASPAFRITAVINILCCKKLSEDEEEEKEGEEASVPFFLGGGQPVRGIPPDSEGAWLRCRWPISQ